MLGFSLRRYQGAGPCSPKRHKLCEMTTAKMSLPYKWVFQHYYRSYLFVKNLNELNTGKNKFNIP